MSLIMPRRKPKLRDLLELKYALRDFNNGEYVKAVKKAGKILIKFLNDCIPPLYKTE
jgi:hypothetical protein